MQSLKSLDILHHMNTKHITPIAEAVNPSREAAVEHAVDRANKLIESIKAELISAEMNLDMVAPMPNSKMSREEYKQTMARYQFVNNITERPVTRRVSEARIALGFNQEGIDRFIEAIKIDAASEFDAYVAKLEAKVGDCVAATVDGNLWNESILIVTKADGAVERWKTQMIINISSLGKLFNQFPTRKLKK